MNTRSGQAAKIVLEAAHQIGRIALLLFMLALTALGLLAFSLSRHPLEIPRLASWLATAASGDGISVHMDKAELAWAGYRQGGAMPLVLRLSQISVHNARGLLLVAVPQADAVVPPGDLFGGRRAILLRATAAQIAGSQAPVTVHANLWPGGGFTLARGIFYVSIGPGMLGPAGTGVPVTAAGFSLQTSPGKADIADGIATLAPIGGSAPHATFTFTARRAKNWTATLHATIDAARAQELDHYWPPAAIPLTRKWVTRHITAGTASNAAWDFNLTAPGDLSTIGLANAVGGFDGTGLTLTWLPGVVPITGLNGHFAMPDINNAVITATAGDEGKVVMRTGQMTITGLNEKDQTGVLKLQLAGTATDALAVLDAPPLALLHGAPAMVTHLTAQVDSTLGITIPFKRNLTFADVKLNVAVALHRFAMPIQVANLGFSQGEAQIQTDGHALTVKAKAKFAGEPSNLTMSAHFAGAGGEELTMQGAAGPQIWHALGLDTANGMSSPAAGTAPFTLHVSGAITGAQAAQLHADLTPAAIALPMAGWSKQAGAKGDFALGLRLNNGQLLSVQNFTAHASGLNVEGAQKGNTLNFATADIGRTQASGMLSWPTAKGGSWTADFSGAVLDIRQSKPGHAAPAKPAPPSGPGWTAKLNFAQLYLAASPAPALGQLILTAQGQGGTPLQVQATAQGLTLAITPKTPTSRALTLNATDTGTFLRALNQYPNMQGGVLVLQAVYGSGQPATGKVQLTNARFANAPNITKLLQALTLYGLADAASGPGLKISRAELPFTLDGSTLTLKEARAFSSSLGFTASGRFDLDGNTCDLDTTIVPAYALNALPGKIPVLGRLFSPEKGGGVLAMRAHISGSLDHPKISINPLSALTPGFLRGIFGIGEKK